MNRNELKILIKECITSLLEDNQFSPPKFGQSDDDSIPEEFRQFNFNDKQIDTYTRLASDGFVPSGTQTSRPGVSTVLQASLPEIKNFTKQHGRMPSILHAGAGKKKNLDRTTLDKIANVIHYEPGHEDESDRSMLTKSGFDMVLSPFVLNVLPPEIRFSSDGPYSDMANSLQKGGFAIIGVRGDVPQPTPKNIQARIDSGSPWVPYEDGWVLPHPSNGVLTFQRGYTVSQLIEEANRYFSKVEKLKLTDPNTGKSKSSVPIVKAYK